MPSPLDCSNNGADISIIDNSVNDSSSPCPDAVRVRDVDDESTRDSFPMLNSSIPNDDRKSQCNLSFHDSHGSLFSQGSSSTARTIELVAPATLPQGYQFVVKADPKNGLDDDEYLVEVPQAGGVVQGEHFLALVVPHHRLRASKRSLRAQPGHKIPYGSWRDGLFRGLFSFGFFHPVICLACWFSPLLLGQVMTRLGLNGLANPAENKSFDSQQNHEQPRQQQRHHEGSSKSTNWTPFRTLVVLFISHFILIETILSLFIVLEIHSARNSGHRPATWAYLLLSARALARIALFVYVSTVSWKTRQYVRARYAIYDKDEYGQPTTDHSASDCLITVVCHPCSVAQMARHTADYASYDSSCCTSTGLSQFAPLPV